MSQPLQTERNTNLDVPRLIIIQIDWIEADNKRLILISISSGYKTSHGFTDRLPLLRA